MIGAAAHCGVYVLSLLLLWCVPPLQVEAAQMFGATAGEIISPMNAVVIPLMDGVG